MNAINNEATERLIKAMLTLKTPEELRAFLDDICTIKELQDLAQRFDVACKLQSGANYNAVSAATGASSTTISRVNRSLLYGKDGYELVLERLKERL